MRTFDNNLQAFFALVRAGLWEQDVRLSSYGFIDYEKVFSYSEEQSIVGIVAAGLEHVIDVNPPKDILLSFVGRALQLEQRNKAMNLFVSKLINDLQGKGINVLLVKGQGIAQCYSRPELRSSGDIDLLLDGDSYRKSISYLSSISKVQEEEIPELLHQSFVVGNWEVELHGSLRGGLTKRIDNFIDRIQTETFDENKIRVWNHNGVDVLIPAPNNDLIFVFSHILQHFFKEGVGLRQICDLCRLLWAFKNSIDSSLLKRRLSEMRLETEWNVFLTFAARWLGMPIEAIPCYSPNKQWYNKADRICYSIIETGNFGHNRDYSYYKNHSYIKYKTISLIRHCKDFIRQIKIFPVDSVIIWTKMVLHSFYMFLRGR